MNYYKLFKTAVVLFWLFMMGLFIRREVFPYFFARETIGYRKIIPPDLLLKDSWYGIYFKEAKIGYSHTQITAVEKEKAASYIIRTQALVILSILGESQAIWVEAEADLDESHLLKDFSFLLRLGNQRFAVAGNRISPDKLSIEIDTGSDRIEQEISVPSDIVVASLFSPFNIVASLKPGESFTVNFFNPLARRIETTEIRVIKKDRITIAGVLSDALVIESEYQGFKTLSWIDAENGDILKQETPLGWRITKESQLEAMGFARERQGQPLDLAADLSVAADKTLPADIDYLKIRITNLDPGFCFMEDERQKLIERDLGEAILEITSFPFSEEEAIAIPLAENIFPEELASSLFIPSHELEIKKFAKGIAAEEKNSLRAARRIADWMDKNIQKRPLLSIPNAKDVLKTRAGDCNEYAYLFAALARAAGVPTKIVSGLVYQGGRFFYHMWPEVYVGGWLAIDPVLNQDTADATHIKLVEGELANQLELAKIVGKIEIEVLEYR